MPFHFETVLCDVLKDDQWGLAGRVVLARATQTQLGANGCAGAELQGI
jgi:hypothetical protein